MKKKYFHIAILLVTFLFVGIQSILAQEDEALDILGTTEGTGTYFEVTDSEYLNVTVESSESVCLRLESAAQMVVMDLESADGAYSTQITLGGFAPSTTYYKYQDDYQNLETFTTDDNGRYNYTQDLSEPHLVFIQPNSGTLFIPSDTTIGTWDPVTRTYTLTRDVSESIQIDEGNLTLDGAGHTVKGIYLPRIGVTLQGLTVQGEGSFYGIFLSPSARNNTLADNNVSNSYYGIHLHCMSGGNTLTGNTASNNTYGIRLQCSSNNTVTGNTVFSNRNLGIMVWSWSHNNTLMYNTIWDNSTGIMIGTSNNNTITRNTISNNSSDGIHFSTMYYCSYDNRTYNNNFVGNLEQAEDRCGTNMFYLPTPIGGNYWSDHTTPDINGDGFVDDPYYFTNGVDNLPWTRPDGWAPDPDGDGIHSHVDKEPNLDSKRFSDVALGGATSGQILKVDPEITIEIMDAPDPLKGVRVLVSGPAGGFARIKLDGSAGAPFKLGPGEHILTFNTVTLEVLAGEAEVDFPIGGGMVAVGVVKGTVILEEIIIDGELQKLVVHAVEGLVTVNGEVVVPGEIFTCKSVSIDIKPGSDPNCFNNNGHGVIPVAILSSPDFDATQVDPTTVSLDGQSIRIVGKEQTLAHIEDANGDGLDDLVVQIEEDGIYQEGDTVATITGDTVDGTSIVGTDAICIVP